MARPREFDIDITLERAMGVFWSRGYEATSLDDLCEATGLNRSSLYGAFGDKRSVYFMALERYERDGIKRIAAVLANGPIQETFERFVCGLIDDIVAGPGRRGCFIGNCAAELARHDRQAAGLVRRSIQSIETTFRDALESAKGRKELPADTDVKGLARFLTAGVQGLRLVGKANPERASLEDVANWLLRALEG